MPAHLEVRVGKVPGRIENYALNGDRTVRAALAVAGLTQGDLEIKVNSQPATLDTTLNDGDQVVLCKKIKGN